MWDLFGTVRRIDDQKLNRLWGGGKTHNAGGKLLGIRKFGPSHFETGARPWPWNRGFVMRASCAACLTPLGPPWPLAGGVWISSV